MSRRRGPFREIVMTSHASGRHVRLSRVALVTPLWRYGMVRGDFRARGPGQVLGPRASQRRAAALNTTTSTMHGCDAVNDDFLKQVREQAGRNTTVVFRLTGGAVVDRVAAAVKGYGVRDRRHQPVQGGRGAIGSGLPVDMRYAVRGHADGQPTPLSLWRRDGAVVLPDRAPRTGAKRRR
jgi:hypothetical protein